MEKEQLPTRTEQKFKLLTYNTFLRPPFIHANDNDYKNERCKLICEATKDFDFIHFQEVYHNYNYRRPYLLEKTRENGYTTQIVPPNQPLFSTCFIGSGLVTLSKREIESQRFYPFPKGVGRDYLLYKGFLHVVIKLRPQSYLHLFNIHTQASYEL